MSRAIEVMSMLNEAKKKSPTVYFVVGDLMDNINKSKEMKFKYFTRHGNFKEYLMSEFQNTAKVLNDKTLKEIEELTTKIMRSAQISDKRSFMIIEEVIQEGDAFKEASHLPEFHNTYKPLYSELSNKAFSTIINSQLNSTTVPLYVVSVTSNIKHVRFQSVEILWITPSSEFDLTLSVVIPK